MSDAQMLLAAAVLFGSIYIVICLVARIMNRRKRININPDEKPKFEDYAGKGYDPQKAYQAALQAWEQKQAQAKRELAKQCVYYMPIEEILAREDGEQLFELEIKNRHPKIKRGLLSRNVDSRYDAYCEICGAYIGKSIVSESLCDGCQRQMSLARTPGSGYTLPVGLSTFSPQLWTRQMIIEFDLDAGVISKIQAEREHRLVIEFEKRRLAEEETKQQSVNNEAEAKQQKRDQISTVASRLLH